MADMSIDTSSYPKAALPVSSPLDVAAKIGEIRQRQNTLQQQQLGISQAKLDQANQALTYMVRAMGSLGPNANKEDYAKAAQNAVDQGLVPQQQENTFLTQLQAAPDSPSFYRQFMSAAQQGFEQLKMRGIPATVNDNANIQSGTVDPVTGAFKPSTTTPIQVPPTQPNVNNQPTVNGQPNPSYMQPGIVGANRPSGTYPVKPGGLPVAPLNNAPAAPSAVPSLPAQRPPAAVPGPITNPAINGQSSNFGGNVVGANVSQPIATGPVPNYAPGLALHNQENAVATGKATALKPLEEAYDLAKLVSTGSGTETLNKARAYLTNVGLISANEKNPAVIYQMLNKNLAQFVDKTGSRSDADLAIKESSNANAKTQLQPALLHMVQKIIGRERIEIARPKAFTGADEQNYPAHSSSFPTSQDERAYSIDKMPVDEAKQLYNTMKAKALAGNPEGIKFIKSLAIAKKTGQVTGLGQ